MGKEKKLPTEEELSEIIRKAQELPYAQRVKIAHHLNKDEWIEELPGKPEGFDAMSVDEKGAWITPIYRYMSRLIGDKAILRHYHKTELGATDQEFDDWWASRRYEEIKHYLRECGNSRNSGRDNRNDSRPPQEFGMEFLLGLACGVGLSVLVVAFLAVMFVLQK